MNTTSCSLVVRHKPTFSNKTIQENSMSCKHIRILLCSSKDIILVPVRMTVWIDLRDGGSNKRFRLNNGLWWWELPLDIVLASYLKDALFPCGGTSWGQLLNERDVFEEKLRKFIGGCGKEGGKIGDRGWGVGWGTAWVDSQTFPRRSHIRWWVHKRDRTHRQCIQTCK